MIDAYASLPHYAAHLLPIWKALPAEARGAFYAPRASDPWGEPLKAAHPRDRIVMVAGFSDAQKFPRNRLVYVEHGAGQTYLGDTGGSYSGGDGLDHVRLFLAPSERVADRWRNRYPATPAVAVGCPRLDPWHRGQAPEPFLPTIALTFHWNCPTAPESRWALPHYQADIAAQVARWRAEGWRVLGHGHPRAWGVLARLWHRYTSVTPCPDYNQVLDEADILVGDNTSALYEFASLDRPVVVLNAPWYRRDVEHGLRFWSLVPGWQVDGPEELAGLDWRANGEMFLGDTYRASRRRVVREVYAHTDGTASARAATAIQEALG